MILVWGLPGDSTLSLVRDRLDTLGSRVAFVNQHRTLGQRVTLAAGERVEGHLKSADVDFEFADVSAFYLRPYESPRLPSVARLAPEDPARVQAVELEDVLLSFADLSPSLVINRPRAMSSNSSKPFQAAWIEQFGLRVPKTLTTTDPAAVTAFLDEAGALIYKSVSGVRSVVAQWTGEDQRRLENIVWCPTQFQELIRGVDYRIHVVGQEVFACRITTSADDYRYATRAGGEVQLESADVPADIAQACIDMSAAMGLYLSGVDLRLREDGSWYCFEVNPSPAFAYYQRGAGQEIAMSVAQMLQAAQHQLGMEASHPKQTTGAPHPLSPCRT